jgi:aspartyl-tRNA(Asn)/glutamyl-tRNA(Gln) amidotransferase subunit B
VGSADCSMEQGSMRVDANISIRPKGSDQLNTKVEVKNMNSIHHVGDAIAYEINRQMGRLNAGESIVLHTRLWDPEKRITSAMRDKFEGPCIPDPSVPQISLSNEWLENIQSQLPEMPGQKVERFVREYGLPYDEAVLMSSERDLSDYFEAVVEDGISPRTAVQWIASQLMPAVRERNQTISNTPVTPDRLGELLAMLERDEINAKSARDVLSKLFESGEGPDVIVKKYGFKQVSDVDELEGLVDQIISANPDAVDDFKSGVAKAMGFLIGQAMQASQGKANPKLIREILMTKIGTA